MVAGVDTKLCAYLQRRCLFPEPCSFTADEKGATADGWLGFIKRQTKVSADAATGQKEDIMLKQMRASLSCLPVGAGVRVAYLPRHCWQWRLKECSAQRG